MSLKLQKYRPDIDGLRAIAILAVVGYHAFPGKVAGGFIGVDIFFVISGYLISTIIFSSLQQECFSVYEFYMRRIRRIFPALTLVLAACLAFGWYVLLPDEFSQLGKHTAAGAAFVQNFVLNKESGYFDTAGDTKPLLHLWSLAVEEQFYLLWPLLMMLIWKEKWSILISAILIGVVSFVFNIYWTQNDQAQAFYLPFSRLWELVLGGVLAYIILRRPIVFEKFKNTRAALGLLLILSGICLIGSDRMFPGWWVLFPTFGAFLVISAGKDAWINKILIGNTVLTGIGSISYPLYLWHWPLLVFVRFVSAEGAMPTREMKALAIAVSFVFSWLTYYYIEKRLMLIKSTTAINVLVGLMLVALLVGFSVDSRIISPRNNSQDVQRMVYIANDHEGLEGLDKIVIDDHEFAQTKNFRSPYVLFVGDSHAAHYGPQIKEKSESNLQGNSIRFLVQFGCFPVPKKSSNYNGENKECAQFRELIKKSVLSNDVKTIIVSGCWNCYFLPDAPNKGKAGESFGSDISKANSALDDLRGFLEFIKKHNKKIFFLHDTPFSEEFSPKSYISGNRLSMLSVKTVSHRILIGQAQFDLNKKLESIVKSVGVASINPLDFLCNEANECMSSALDSDGRLEVIYNDTDHLRPFFIRQYANYLDEALWEN